MKGISTILAMILIVIIVVALIGLTYTFAVGLFSTTTTGATEQTAAVTTRLQKTVAIVASSCANITSGVDAGNDSVKFTLKHTGTIDIETNELSAFLGGSKISPKDTVTSNTLEDTSLSAGSLSNEFEYNTTDGHKTPRTLRISAPAGEVDVSLTCTT